MKINKYKKLKSNKYEVLLDNGEKLSLFEDVILKEELLIKKEITDIDRIIEINKEYEIYDVALKYLNHHVISVKSMKNYLLKKKYNLHDIDKVVDKLICKGLLNDDYYAKCYINNQVNLSNDGPLKIKKHLEDSDIPYNVYIKYLDRYNDIWKDRIGRYINKNLKNNKKSSYFFKNKMLINLINLGYEKEMISDCLSSIQIDNVNELKEIEEKKIRKKLERKYAGEELERKIKEKLYQKGFFE